MYVLNVYVYMYFMYMYYMFYMYMYICIWTFEHRPWEQKRNSTPFFSQIIDIHIHSYTFIGDLSSLSVGRTTLNPEPIKPKT